jgi:hypothetical protein
MTQENMGEREMPLSSVISSFEDAVKKYIADNVGMINFSHPQYSIKKISDNQYDITFSVTGLGIQHYTLMLNGDTFTFSGKVGVVGSDAAYPVALFGGMINNMLQKWVASTVEDLAVQKAKMALLKAKATHGKPVNAVITIVPADTTETTVKDAKPVKTIVVKGE